MKRVLLITFLSVLLDQVIKILISFYMNINESITIINNFFNMTYVKNEGAAWSMLSGNRLLLIILGLIAINVIYFLFIYNKKLTKKEEIAYGLLIGGIVGNMVDRVVYGSVIDYLDFNIFGYNYPIFNLADILIVTSVILILFFTFKEKHETNSR